MARLSPDERRTVFSASLLFRSLDPEDQERLLAVAALRDLGPGEALFRKGDDADAVYVVLRGSVQVVSNSEDGRERTLRILAPGSVVGELGILHRGKRTATIVGGDDCTLLAIGRRDFLRLVEAHPKLAVQMLGALAARIDELTSELSDLFFLGVPARLAKKLLDLAALYGEPAAEGLKIAHGVSQQDLANLVGTSRESINKQLRRWEEQGLIRIRRRELTVLRPAALEALVAAAKD